MHRRSLLQRGAEIVLATLLVLLPLGAAQAGTFDPEASYLEIRIANVPAIMIPVTGPGEAVLLDDGPNGLIIQDDLDVWNVTGVTAPGGPFGDISGVTVTVANSPGSLFSSFSLYSATNWAGTGILTGFGGTEPLTGYIVLEVLSGESVMVPLFPVGSGGVSPFTAKGAVSDGQIAAGAFATGAANITGIQTELISIPNRGKGVTGVAFTLQPTPLETTVPLGKMVSTVTVSGTNGLVSASQAGYVRLVAPVRIVTSGLFTSALPVAVYKYFAFQAPEPGTALLYGAAIATLVAIGRRKMRKR